MTKAASNMRQSKGYTLIEMVVVIVVLGIVSVGMTNFIGLGADIYSDAVGRDQMLSQTRYAIERLTREIREALPNSVRVGSSLGIECVEFVPIQASSTYVNIPVAPEAASNTIHIVRHAVTGITPDKIVVYPLTSADVYGTNALTATTGNIFSFPAAPAVGTVAQDLTLGKTVQFDADSPTHRYYLVDKAVSYCANTTTGQLMRYDGYWPSLSGQQMPPAGVTGVLMAENIKAGSTPFDYSSATLVTNAVIQFTFEIVRDGEQIDFHHEVHLINVP